MSKTLLYLSPELFDNFTEDSRIVSEEVSSDPFKVSPERIRKLLDRIPPREADFAELYYIEGKSQAVIASLFQVTQGDVSYRLGKSCDRIRFLLDLPEIDVDKMEKDLEKILPQEDPNNPVLCGGDLYVKVMMGMYKTTCQSAVAKSLGIVQGRVRHRLVKSMKLLKIFAQREPEVYGPYLEVFQKIMANANILQELKVYRTCINNSNYTPTREGVTNA